MNGPFKPPRKIIGNYGNAMISYKTVDDFKYLLNKDIYSIILFEDSTDEIKEKGEIILPRHYYIIAGTKDGELQFKPYEYDQYRIVVSTYKDIIMSIDSIG